MGSAGSFAWYVQQRDRLLMESQVCSIALERRFCNDFRTLRWPWPLNRVMSLPCFCGVAHYGKQMSCSTQQHVLSKKCITNEGPQGGPGRSSGPEPEAHAYSHSKCICVIVCPELKSQDRSKHTHETLLLSLFCNWMWFWIKSPPPQSA